jgi:hypothetical protein
MRLKVRLMRGLSDGQFFWGFALEVLLCFAGHASRPPVAILQQPFEHSSPKEVFNIEQTRFLTGV